MEQLIPFKHDIIFKNKLNEITSISLEHTLKFDEDSNEVNGDFIIEGTYKITEVSDDETFAYKLPFNIILDKKYEQGSVSVDIDDFNYEIVNNEALHINIDVYLTGEEIMEREEVVEVKEIEEVPEVEEVKEEVKEERLENEIAMPASTIEEDIGMFNNLSDEDKYVSYHVHIVRSDENIDIILEKYNVKLEDLEKYNDLQNMSVGTKLIIPESLEEN